MSFLKKTAPSEISNTRSKKLFDSRGPFGELSSKLDIALVCNLIPINVIDSIHKLRKLRNNLAHRTSPFSLKENLDSIYDVFTTLDSAAPSCFLDIYKSAIYDEYVDKMMRWDKDNNHDTRLFTTRDDVINFLQNKPEILDTLMEKRIKALFVVGVSTLAAIIIFHREIVVEKMAK
jgi:hypothetical protein